jgi:cyclic pyranopterin monophosphate synthase
MSGLSHLDSDGRARMVDVGDKPVTARAATASGRFVTTAEVIALVRADGMPKADVLATARIAGIQGAKKTSELIPLCHPLPLSSVNVSFEFEETSIVVTATAKTTGQTGVEMEALTAVAIAGLTLHDMVKAVDAAASMTDVRVVEKTGGKSDLVSTGSTSAAVIEPVEITPNTAIVLVSSTRSAAGTQDDTTGPRIAAWLDERHYSTQTEIVADADIATALAAAVAARPSVIITTGGTGASPTDRTPEATRAVLDRELPGVAEAIRALGLTKTPTAALSRALAGVANGTVVVNLPGSPGGVKDGLSVLDELLPHLVAQVAGGGAHE